MGPASTFISDVRAQRRGTSTHSQSLGGRGASNRDIQVDEVERSKTKQKLQDIKKR